MVPPLLKRALVTASVKTNQTEKFNVTLTHGGASVGADWTESNFLLLFSMENKRFALC